MNPPETAMGPLTRRNLVIAGGLLSAGGIASSLLRARASAAPLDLSGYHLVFDEDFSNLDVSARGPGTRWTAHTPWAGDFGDAAFADPEPGFPFTTEGGMLRIEARKDADGRWRSGLLSSVGPDGQGFAQQYGYFEMRAKLPPGAGLWPAFWLDSMTPKGSSDPSIEIDVIEYYGQFPRYFHSTVIVWPADRKQKNQSVSKMVEVADQSLCQDFHTYGVSVDPDWIVTYLDRRETWRTPTPPQHRHSLMILVDLALGGGWPIEQTPSPSVMIVDYVRAWRR